MPSATSNECQVLLRYLKGQREHIFEALEGLDVDDLRRQVLPSHWTCLGLVNHLSLDVERFWFQAVIAGDQAAVEDVLGSSDNAWDVGIEDSAEAVLQGYRHNIERADAIIATALPRCGTCVVARLLRLLAARQRPRDRAPRHYGDRRPHRSP